MPILITGTILKEHRLGYIPAATQAVACNYDNIFVVERESKEVHVHDFNGKEIYGIRLSHLGWNSIIDGVWWVNDQLMLATGDLGFFFWVREYVTAIHRISLKSKD